MLFMSREGTLDFMTQAERDKLVLDPFIAQLSEHMTSLHHLTYVVTTLSEHYIPVPVSHINVIGIYGTLADVMATFHAKHVRKGQV